MKLVFLLIFMLFCVFTEIKCGWKPKAYWRNKGQNSNSNTEQFKVTKAKQSNDNKKEMHVSMGHIDILLNIIKNDDEPIIKQRLENSHILSFYTFFTILTFSPSMFDF